MVEMAQLRVVASEFELPAVLQRERNPVSCGRLDRGGGAVDDAETVMVACPAHRPVLTALKGHLAGLVVDARDPAHAALLDVEPLVGPVRHHHVAHGVVSGERRRLDALGCCAFDRLARCRCAFRPFYPPENLRREAEFRPDLYRRHAEIERRIGRTL